MAHNKSMNSKKFISLVGFIAVCELAGIIGSIFTMPAIPTWYANLIKPELTPPAWVFGPVWTTLFALMGIAAWLVWTAQPTSSAWKSLTMFPWTLWHKWRNGKTIDVQKIIALKLFVIQLILNTAWSIIFFGLQDPGLAYMEIILLWIAIIATIIAFYKISRLAAWLLVPYVLWVSFAMYLNYTIWTLN